MSLSLTQKIAIWLLPLLFAITLHEVAHGYVASLLGDQTAKRLGRLSLNPLRHIDPVGTLLVPSVLLFLGGFIFGWAKPVPVHAGNLRHPRRDMMLVSVAGPMANVAMAIAWAGVCKIGLLLLDPSKPNMFMLWLAYMGQAGITINLVLAILNMLPLPPLDGGHIVSGLLPKRMSYYYDRVAVFGFFILIALLATGVLQAIIYPPLRWGIMTLSSLFGLPFSI
jgi:Zn-dependent protease